MSFHSEQILLSLLQIAQVCSLGRKIVIEELTLDTIDAIIESDGYVYGTSNVQKVLEQDVRAAPAVSSFSRRFAGWFASKT